MPLEALVFTDQQYWRAVGNPGDFASRVFAQALGGTCVFIGVSMTDMNLMRWLVQHTIEVKRDFRSMTDGWKDAFDAVYNEFVELSGHFWITVGNPSPRREKKWGRENQPGAAWRARVDVAGHSEYWTAASEPNKLVWP